MGIFDDFFVHPRSIFLGMLRLRYTSGGVDLGGNLYRLEKE
jgi:hypothetical protein